MFSLNLPKFLSAINCIWYYSHIGIQHLLVVIEMTGLAILARAYYRIYPEDSTTAKEVNPYVPERFRPK